MESKGFKYEVYQPTINETKVTKRGFHGLKSNDPPEPSVNDMDFVNDPPLPPKKKGKGGEWMKQFQN